jgi:SulP family sulfate permease
MISNVKNDLVAGVLVAVLSLPMSIAMGVLAFAPLGPEYAASGALAGLYSSVILSLIPILFRHTPQQCLSPSPISSGIFAALVAVLMTHGAVAQLAAQVGVGTETMVITLAFLCALVAGVLQVLIGMLRLGETVKLLPHPVVAGIINGVAIGIILSQLPALFGTDASAGTVSVAGLRLVPATTAVGLGTLGAIVAAERWAKRIPAPLAGLVAGTVLYHLLGRAAGLWAGPVLGAVPSGFPRPDMTVRMTTLLGNPQLPALIMSLVGMILMLAIMGALSALLTATTADTLSITRHDSRRELAALGAGNIVAALFSGIPGGGSLSKIMNNYRFGGRTYLAQVTCGAVTLVIVGGGGRFFGVIPLSVIAGVLIYLAMGFIDPWSRRIFFKVFSLKERELRINMLFDLMIVALVLGLVLWADLVTALAGGMIAAFVVYLNQSQHDVIRRRYRADQVHSKTVRRPEATEVLETHGGEIQVLELQGPLFFGTADRLARELESITARTVILDLRRVSNIDSSGALLLRRLDRRLSSDDRVLLPAGLPRGDERRMFLTEMGLAEPETQGRMYDDVDTALAAAEEILLRGVDPALVSEARIPLSSADIFEGFSKEDMAVVALLMPERNYKAGEHIMVEGEPADGLYVLLRGRVGIMKHQAETGRAVPIVNFGPGVCIGEIAVLSGSARTADVDATTDAECCFMSLKRFGELKRDRPELVSRLLVNIGVSMARRLAASTVTISELES